MQTLSASLTFSLVSPSNGSNILAHRISILERRPVVKTTLIPIPKPCTASWEAMNGDERSRYCETCATHVHDLSAVTLREAEEKLMAGHRSGKLCVRYSYNQQGDIQFKWRRVLATAPARQLRGARRLTAAASAILMLAGMSELMESTIALAQTPPIETQQIRTGGFGSSLDGKPPTNVPYTEPQVHPNKDEVLNPAETEGSGADHQETEATSNPNELPELHIPTMPGPPATDWYLDVDEKGIPTTRKSPSDTHKLVAIEMRLHAQERFAVIALRPFGITMEEEQLVSWEAELSD